MAVYDPNAVDNSAFFAEIKDADIIINCYVNFNRELIDGLEKCKVISFESTGYNEVDLDYAREKGIAAISILDYCTQETAENAFTLMLCLQRATMKYHKLVQERHIWDASAVSGLKPPELAREAPDVDDAWLPRSGRRRRGLALRGTERDLGQVHVAAHRAGEDVDALVVDGEREIVPLRLEKDYLNRLVRAEKIGHGELVDGDELELRHRGERLRDAVNVLLRRAEHLDPVRGRGDLEAVNVVEELLGLRSWI